MTKNEPAASEPSAEQCKCGDGECIECWPSNFTKEDIIEHAAHVTSGLRERIVKMQQTIDLLDKLMGDDKREAAGLREQLEQAMGRNIDYLATKGIAETQLATAVEALQKSKSVLMSLPEYKFKGLLAEIEAVLAPAKDEAQ